MEPIDTILNNIYTHGLAIVLVAACIAAIFGILRKKWAKIKIEIEYGDKNKK